VAVVAERRCAVPPDLLGLLEIGGDLTLALVAVAAMGPGAAVPAWPLLGLVALEGGVRFGVAGAIGAWGPAALLFACWASVRGGEPAARVGTEAVALLPAAVVVGTLRDVLAREVARFTRSRRDAEARSTLLRTVAAAGLDMAAALDFEHIRNRLAPAVIEMGFEEPRLLSRPRRMHRDRGTLVDLLSSVKAPLAPPEIAIACRAVEEARTAVSRPNGPARVVLVGLIVPTRDDDDLVLVARSCDEPTDERIEALELLAAEAGAAIDAARSHTEVARMKDQMAHRAYHDSLTGLPNRAQFTERLEAACANRGPEPRVALMFLDLDGFKKVNDTLGHDRGNDLLVGAAQRLRRVVPTDALVARLGGDEFTVLFEHFDAFGDVEHTAERIRAAISAPFSLDGEPAGVSTSIGIAKLAAGECADDLLRRADAAMYAAKQAGRNRWVVAGPDVPAALPSA
jgi:diguanylate cyclase (GGDEF)-like protein